jgi:tetratricopeptide (TPR) repeat protein
MQLKYLAGILFFIGLFSCTGKPAKKMSDIMESIRKGNYNSQNSFSSRAKLAFMDSMISNISNSNQAQFNKANVLLQAGDEKQSVAILEQMLAQSHSHEGQIYQQILKSYAIASLRLGERQNCVMGHSAESCIMPVRGTGIHKIQLGSLNAIKAYTELLKINPYDLECRWLLNIAYMTIGEYPSQVPAQWLIANLDKDTSGYPVKAFKDIAPQLRLDTKNRSGGMIADDFNNDGFLDVITSDWDPGSPMHYFKNNGNGTFSDISIASGLNDVKGGLNIMQADYNNDGFIDILVLRGGWLPGKFGKQPNSLLRNNGNNTFTDVTLESGLFSLHPTQTAVWRDFNNDGWLDLFIGNETSQQNDPNACELFISDQHGGFKDMAVQAGCNKLGFIKGVASADYNNDGLMDIFISGFDGSKTLLKNTGIEHGIPHFEDVTSKAGLDKDKIKTFPTWFWDYDNDGWPDIFVSGFQYGGSIAYTAAAEALKMRGAATARPYLYHNNHDGTFTDVALQAGLGSSVFGMGSNFGDIDNDGYLDMYIGTGNPDYGSLTPNKLYKNVDGKKFVDVTVSARVGNLQKGHGVAFADIDNDGDQDILLETGGAYDGDAYYNSLYLNPGQNNNRWLYISFVGTKSNRSAIGSRIKISFKENGIERTIHRDVNSGGSFGSSTLRREIGIGQCDMVDELTITWAGTNTSQTFKNIRTNQWIKIIEGKDTIEKLPLTTLQFETNAIGILPCAPDSQIAKVK